MKLILVIILCVGLYHFVKPFRKIAGCIVSLLILLTLWLVLGLAMKACDSEEPKQVATDMQMAETFIKDNPKLCKNAKLKVLTDGTVKIITRKKSFYLKWGVLTDKR